MIHGGRPAVASDAAPGAACDGSLRVFSCIPGTGVYSNTGLPDVILTGGAPTVAGSGNLFSSAFGANANNNLFLSLSNQTNDISLPSLPVGLTRDSSPLNTRGLLTVVPEPAGAAPALAGFALLMRRRRA